MVRTIIVGVIAIFVLGIVIIGTQPIEATLTREEIAEHLEVDVNYIKAPQQPRTILHTVVNNVVKALEETIVEKDDNPVTDTTEIMTEEAIVVLTPATPRTTVQTGSLELYREFTFDDGSVSKSTHPFKALDFKLSSLDILTLSHKSKTMNNGTIKYTLVVPVPLNVDIDSIHGEFSMVVGDTVHDTVTFDGDNSNVNNVGDVYVFSKRYAVSDLLDSQPYGRHVVGMRVDSLYVDYADGIREYTASGKLVHSYFIEKERSAEDLILLEEIDPVTSSTQPYDAEISIHRKYQNVSVKVCTTTQNGMMVPFGTGCSDGIAYETRAIIPAPGLGAVTITHVSTDTIVATVPAVSAPVCDIHYTFLEIPITTCVVTTGVREELHSGLIYTAQRGESYRIDITDPLKSWVIDVPLTGGKSTYKYGCVDIRTATELDSLTVHGVPEYHIDSVRHCNFP